MTFDHLIQLSSWLYRLEGVFFRRIIGSVRIKKFHFNNVFYFSFGSISLLINLLWIMLILHHFLLEICDSWNNLAISIHFKIFFFLIILTNTLFWNFLCYFFSSRSWSFGVYRMLFFNLGVKYFSIELFLSLDYFFGFFEILCVL